MENTKAISQTGRYNRASPCFFFPFNMIIGREIMNTMMTSGIILADSSLITSAATISPVLILPR